MLMNAPRASLIITAIRAQSEELQTRTEPSEVNSAVSRILDFLAADIYSCPELLQAVDSSLVTRINSLVRHVEADLDVPLLADDE